MSDEAISHDFYCENFLVPCDPNQRGNRQWKNFLRQWYLHGPFPMTLEIRQKAKGGYWDEVIEFDAVSGEAQMRPNVLPVTDPRDMVKNGAWMRWETYSCKGG